MTPDNKALIGRVRAKATGVKYAGWADTVAVCDLAERLAEPQAGLVTTIIAEVEDWLEDYYENPPRAAKVARRIARQFTGRLLPDGCVAVPVADLDFMCAQPYWATDAESLRWADGYRERYNAVIALADAIKDASGTVWPSNVEKEKG